MKKIVLFSVTLLAAAGLLPTVIAQAEETVPASKTTTGTVQLTVDPDIDHPGGGNGDGEDTGQKGEFTLDHVVSYDFGEQTITGGEMTLNATQKLPYVQVTDLREKNSGWQLLTSITEFKSTDEDNPKILSGAELKLPKGAVEAVDMTNTSKQPTANDVILNGKDQTLFSAEANAGTGSWMDTMFGEATTLHIPAGATPGAYKAEITWTLQDAPSGTF
ncbi:hypothetical protein BAU15_01585 [Enterococcus sp. JM4C]|uniref:WxL domain-containing protein n=1 Tax=Candidatus Enterococcus huntleyi TaxID=1857217 RepID=UPI00137B76DC|nr:WxL domain-containing protein [Enterococcus sp. JM4C]KAF1299365.1 hypothetical protein BAU15_01585 [Enterococcus sp. JM4C]